MDRLRTRKAEYRYSAIPADSNHIRLLSIQPGHANSKLRCSLLTYSLADQSLSYEALSYAWEDPTKKRLIICDDKPLHVTDSLYAALMHLRLADKPRLVWADAICINQLDYAEKGHQVEFMAKIYISATRTVAWLGREEPDAKLAVDTLSNIAKRCLEAADIHVDEVNEVTKIESHKLVNALIAHAPPDALDPSTNEEEWAAISRFFERSWWERMWVCALWFLYSYFTHIVII